MANVLRVEVRSGSTTWADVVETRLLVDGVDVVGEVFDEGPSADPDHLLGPDSPLLSPGEVRLAEADCTEGCCGALYVRVRREADEVVWDGWRNPDAPDVELGEFRFAAVQYEAELARAHHVRLWEWRAREAARLAVPTLTAALARWNCSLDFATSRPTARDVVEVVFTSPPRGTERMAHTQYRLRFPAGTAEPARLAADIAATVAATDPRARAEVCGGYGP